MRSLVVLGITGLLACALALTSFAVDGDMDDDGVLDPDDNCLTVPNGPLASTYFCDDQEDGDLDGFGNACDTNTSNSGSASILDMGSTIAKAAAVSTDNNHDFNCNGAVDQIDVRISLLDAVNAAVPGPSGKACAGTIPCP